MRDIRFSFCYPLFFSSLLKQMLIPSARCSNCLICLFPISRCFSTSGEHKGDEKRNGCESGHVHRRTINEIDRLFYLSSISHFLFVSLSPNLTIEEKSVAASNLNGSLTFMFVKRTTVAQHWRRFEKKTQITNKKARLIVRSRNSRSRISLIGSSDIVVRWSRELCHNSDLSD